MQCFTVRRMESERHRIGLWLQKGGSESSDLILRKRVQNSIHARKHMKHSTPWLHLLEGSYASALYSSLAFRSPGGISCFATPFALRNSWSSRWKLHSVSATPNTRETFSATTTVISLEFSIRGPNQTPHLPYLPLPSKTHMRLGRADQFTYRRTVRPYGLSLTLP